MRRASCVALTLLALLAASAPSTAAADSATVHVAFRPAKLGSSTTIALDFQVAAARRGTLSPLASVELRLPAGVSAGSSTLGTATCSLLTLQSAGPRGCSPNALIGHGSATVGVPLGSQTVSERVEMTIVMAPAIDEHTTVLFYASGTTPVISQEVFQAALLGDVAPFGTKLDTTIPPIAGLPGSPDASLIGMHAEIGPQGLTYYRRVHGRRVSYSPQGFKLPARCPRGGFPGAAVLVFADGSSEAAVSRTPCPAGRAGRPRS